MMARPTLSDRPRTGSPATVPQRMTLAYLSGYLTLAFVVLAVGALTWVLQPPAVLGLLLMAGVGASLGAFMGLRHARLAQKPFEAAIGASNEAMLLLEGTKIVMVNASAAAMLGRDPGRVVGEHLDRILEGRRYETPAGEVVLLSEALADATGKPEVLRAVGGGQSERWLEYSVTTPPSGRPNQTLVTVRDITAQRALDTVREQILQVTSHDLRAPLTVITGYLDILRKPLDEETKAHALKAAKLNARKMEELLDDLSDAANAEELLKPRETERVSLADLAEEVVGSLGPTDSAHRLHGAVESRPEVIGEARRLRQALVNLVINAIKYSPEGSTITVRVRSDEGRAVLAVEDEGPGVPADTREDVFLRFKRLDDARATRPGVGLGLYIVKLIAENHGGSARVESGPGRGARFVIELPLAPTRN